MRSAKRMVRLLAASKIHADDTPIPVLAPGMGKTKIARLWTYVRDDRPAGFDTPPAVWFPYTSDRKGEHPRQHLSAGGPFQHTVQIEEVCIMRSLRKQLASQRHRGLIFCVEDHHLQINTLRFDIVGMTARQLLGNLLCFSEAQLLAVNGYKRRSKGPESG